MEPKWSAAEKLEFEQAVMELAQGKRSKPSEEMSTAHFLSHHVMHLRHSERSCKRMLRKICRQAGQTAAVAAGSESDSDSEDSDEEVVLPAPLGQ